MDRVLQQDERKNATILFADIVGSTSLVSRRDPEVALDILRPALNLLSEAVQRPWPWQALRVTKCPLRRHAEPRWELTPSGFATPMVVRNRELTRPGQLLRFDQVLIEGNRTAADIFNFVVRSLAAPDWLMRLHYFNARNLRAFLRVYLSLDQTVIMI